MAGRNGEAYFVTDADPVEFRSWLTRLSATLRVAPPNAQAPRWLAATIAGAGDALGSLTCEVP